MPRQLKSCKWVNCNDYQVLFSNNYRSTHVPIPAQSLQADWRKNTVWGSIHVLNPTLIVSQRNHNLIVYQDSNTQHDCNDSCCMHAANGHSPDSHNVIRRFVTVIRLWSNPTHSFEWLPYLLTYCTTFGSPYYIVAPSVGWCNCCKGKAITPATVPSLHGWIESTV